jgi:mannose-6-phosphate isomerase-like protein (cupin superfamily)
MRIAHSETTPWGPVRSTRGGVIKFKTLLEGREGRPDNYQLLLADTDPSFKSPRHRHNFDQVRFALTGATNIGPKRNLEAGDLAYFPEGTYYGPQDQEEVGKQSLTMVIQFGGPSGNGYMSMGQHDENARQMKADGDFEGGIYKRHSPAADGRKNQDAYEAIWEHHSGRPIEYQRPRFMDAIHFREPNFEWLPVAGNTGVATKDIATFTEKGVKVSFVQLKPGASHTLAAQPQQQLLFVRSGTGQFASKAGEWFEHTAVDISPGESVGLTATTLTEAMVLVFPRV